MQAELGLATFLIVWWAIAAGLNTSVDGPYFFVGNGYFATWLALFGALLYGAHAYVIGHSNIHTRVFHHTLVFLLAAAVIVMVSISMTRVPLLCLGNCNLKPHNTSGNQNSCSWEETGNQRVFLQCQLCQPQTKPHMSP